MVMAAYSYTRSVRQLSDTLALKVAEFKVMTALDGHAYYLRYRH